MPPFDGETFNPEHDGKRLATLLEAVRNLMADGEWRTLAQIHEAIKRGSEASISARLRDLRKAKFGGFDVQRRRDGDPAAGLWSYRLNLEPVLAGDQGKLFGEGK